MIDRFALAFREQQQLFLYDKTYLVQTFCTVGGLATLSGRFLVQFFWSPVLAVIITMVLLGLGVWLLWGSLREKLVQWQLLPLCFIPFVFLAASLSENAMHFSVLTAWLIALAALYAYTRIRANKLVWGILLTAVVYLTAGPAALLFALCAAIIGLWKKDWTSALLVPVALLCGLGAWLLGWTPTLASALTPAFYFDLDAPMNAAHWIPWVLLPLTVLGGCFIKEMKRIPALATGSTLLLIALFPAFSMARKAENRQPGITFEYEYYTVNENWDGLIKACLKNEWIPHTAQYLNLALSQKDQLLEKMFQYDQRGPDGLVRMSADRGVETSQAHIMFAMGNAAAAQDVAFNTLYSTEGICPAMLKINAQVELMRGTYGVADKYLSILEKAPHYRRWAREQRRFLYDDAAVEADPLLGNGRRSWPKLEGFSMFESPLDELMRVIDANPGNRRGMEYALAYLLLSKDIKSVTGLVSRYYGQSGLLSLPVPVQEAVLFYSEYTRNVSGADVLGPEWCKAHGVTEETFQRFQKFQDASLKNGGKAPKGYQSSYWYFLLYKQI
ncbi:MAG: hypothetical protein IJP81_02600 [Bacteroidales bacterium]|nr:hypothetical protein [Bacteroidales bacterium]